MTTDIKNYWTNKFWYIKFFELATYLFVGTIPLLLKVNTLALWIFAFASIIFSYIKKDWKNNLAKNKSTILIFFLLFGLYVIGILLSQDLKRVFKDIGRAVPFIILPLIVLSHTKKDFNMKRIYISLGFGLFIGMLICWYHIAESIMSKQRPLDQAKYFFEWIYTDWNLVKPLDGHPSYFAILIVFFICILVTNVHFKNLRNHKLKFLLIIFPFFLFLIETSSRIGIITLMLTLLIYSVKKFRIKGLLMTLSILMVIVLLSLKFDYLGSKFGKIFSSDGQIKMERYHRWKEIVGVFNEKDQWLFGLGSGDARKIYKTAYENGNFTLAFENNYNAHNQYLEFLVSNGIIGLTIYVFFLILFAYQTRIRAEAMCFFIIMVFFSMSESIFGRSQGVIIFSFIYSFLILNYSPLRVLKNGIQNPK